MFFCLMTRPPPRSTLFPYTTLFRSRARPALGGKTRGRPGRGKSSRPPSRFSKNRFRQRLTISRRVLRLLAMSSFERRSEEHTSELQSLTNLVCRLLLEKKKNNTINKFEERAIANFILSNERHATAGCLTYDQLTHTHAGLALLLASC